MATNQKKFVPPPRLVGIIPNPGPRGTKHLEEEKRWNIIFLKKEKKLSPYKIADSDKS